MMTFISSLPNSNTLAERLWPVEGLERQGVCPVCGGPERVLLYDALTDGIYHCSEDRWRLYRCATCRSGYLDPRPTLDTIGRAYARFYTHDVPTVAGDGRDPDRKVGFRESLRNGLINMRYGYHFAPASPLGRLLPL